VERNDITIQETGKRLKLHIIFSMLLFWVGILWIIGLLMMQTFSPIPIILTITGLSWYLLTKFRVWWHHK